MPNYTLIHGGLIIEKKHFPHGSTVDLSTEEAKFINRRGKHLELTSIIKAEADAEAKKASAIARAIADEKKAEADAEAKKQADEKKGGGK